MTSMTSDAFCLTIFVDSVAQSLISKTSKHCSHFLWH